MFAVQISQIYFFFFIFQSHSENANMQHEEKQTSHTQDQEEMSTVEKEIKESRLICFFFSRPIKSFQAPFHAAETMTLFNHKQRKLCFSVLMHALILSVSNG